MGRLKGVLPVSKVRLSWFLPLLLLLPACSLPQQQAPDAALTVAQSCGAIGDLEHLAASEVRAGHVSDVQRARIVSAQAMAKPFCSDQAATAADRGSVAQLRALVPTITSALASKE